MLKEFTQKSKETRQKRVKEFFFSHVYSEHKEIVQQNLDELVQVKARILAQLKSLQHSVTIQKPENPLSPILSSILKPKLSPAYFNSISADYCSHKADLDLMIQYFAQDSLFKIISPEGFPYLESDSPLNDTQKLELSSFDFIILPIFKHSGFSVLCIDNVSKVLEYYSTDQSLFENICVVVEKRLKEINQNELFDWNFMKLPGIVSESWHMIGVFYCLCHNFDLGVIKDSGFFEKLFGKVNEYFVANTLIRFSKD